ncbi:5-formyltetrahydrofolate cyclo-ligase [Geodermatophilus marinus]|uniref:5-formyltetrahydrofolate cyclo-ligase n=1 Tax=Geodermatophilus sp. LHW52908 TaxID=2303986 RepID=UPI001F32BC30|nr:5-formyltetrahydrofolate cyclo-ligase [Geodermatophilus sp. LHW52908]
MPDPEDVAAAKAALRRRLSARRAARPGPERAAAAGAVAAALGAGVPAGSTVAAHVPDPAEPGAGRLLDALAAAGRRVLLPVVPVTGRTLAWAEHTGPLLPGRFGLLEPAGPRLPGEALADAAVVVVPALAVARTGARLGRGAGFYDRALRSARPGALLVAVVFDDELLDALPTGPHDRPVTAVVTPSGGWQALPAGH